MSATLIANRSWILKPEVCRARMRAALACSTVVSAAFGGLGAMRPNPWRPAGRLPAAKTPLPVDNLAAVTPFGAISSTTDADDCVNNTVFKYNNQLSNAAPHPVNGS